MYKVLITFGNWSVSTLGVLYTLAFLIAFLWSLYRAKQFGVSRKAICDITIIALLSFVIGARLYYVILHWARFENDPAGALNIFKGGTAQYGGVIFMVLALVLYSRLRGYSAASLAATISAPFFLAVAIGRLGCFTNGCCFGLPTTSPIGVQFPPWSSASRVGRRLLEDASEVSYPGNDGIDVFVPAVHPTQLYSAFGALICVGLLLWLQRRFSAAIVSGVSIGLIGVLRLAVDHFRYYEQYKVFSGLPTNSWISLALICASIITIVLVRSKWSGEEKNAG